MKVVRNEGSGTWHLIGTRGYGAEPNGETVEGNWAEVRDHDDRDEASQCTRFRWPRR